MHFRYIVSNNTTLTGINFIISARKLRSCVFYRLNWWSTTPSLNIALNTLLSCINTIVIHVSTVLCTTAWQVVNHRHIQSLSSVAIFLLVFCEVEAQLPSLIFLLVTLVICLTMWIISPLWRKFKITDLWSLNIQSTDAYGTGRFVIVALLCVRSERRLIVFRCLILQAAHDLWDIVVEQGIVVKLL